jgi:hypothetical protein
LVPARRLRASNTTIKPVQRSVASGRSTEAGSTFRHGLCSADLRKMRALVRANRPQSGAVVDRVERGCRATYRARNWSAGADPWLPPAGGEGHGIAFCKTTPCKVGERRRPRQRHFDRRRRFAKRSLISGGTASGTLVDWPAPPPARPRSTTAASMSFSSSDGGMFASSGGTDSGATCLHRQGGRRLRRHRGFRLARCRRTARSPCRHAKDLGGQCQRHADHQGGEEFLNGSCGWTTGAVRVDVDGASGTLTRCSTWQQQRAKAWTVYPRGHRGTPATDGLRAGSAHAAS